MCPAWQDYLPIHPGWVYATHKIRSLPGTVPYHNGYNLLLPTPQKIITSLPPHRQDKVPCTAEASSRARQRCPTAVSLCSSFTVKCFRSDTNPLEKGPQSAEPSPLFSKMPSAGPPTLPPTATGLSKMACMPKMAD